MLSKYVRAFVLTALVLACGSAWSQSEGKRECALGYRNSIFVPLLWPDRPLEQLVQGQLGVIAPGFDHFYLFIAYRRMSGKALNMQDLDRLRVFDPCWDDGSNGYHGKDWRSSSLMHAAQREWEAARAQSELPKVKPGKPGAGSVMGYVEGAVPNCNPDAFRTAARTLRSRAAVHGATVWLRDWVEAQDRVIRLCFDASGEMPPAVSADAPDWLRADRAYQIAAAHFYAGHYEQSAQQFAAIDADLGSPWRSWGLYLAARSRLRQASAALQDADRQDHLQQARQLLDAALTTVSDAEVRDSVVRMLQRVRLQTEPEKVMPEINTRLSAEVLDSRVGQDVRDFNPEGSASLPFDVRAPTFAAWVHAMRGGVGPADADIATASPLAIVAWLASTKPGAPRLAELLQRAATIQESSPSYQTVQFHRIRLLPDRLQALQLARKMLALPTQELSIQDRNRIKAQALSMAQSATELAALAYRDPIVHPVVQQLATQFSIPVVDEQGAAVLNRAIPVDRLFELHVSTTTPAPLRRELLGVVWPRALVLERWDLLHKLQPHMLKALPQAATLLQDMRQAADNRERRARAALFLTLHPGIVGSLSTEIAYNDPSQLALPNMHRRLLQEGSRDNWWCSLPPGHWIDGPAPAPPPLPAFLSATETRQWKSEYQRFMATPNGTEYLAPIVLEWAKANPRDPALPDALRMIVRSARGGCVTPSAKWMGRDAFRHLHRYFPKSEAARSTRSWG